MLNYLIRINYFNCYFFNIVFFTFNIIFFLILALIWAHKQYLCEVNLQHAESLHAFKHAPSHRLQVIGCQVKLHHWGGTFERAVLNLWDLVVTQVARWKTKKCFLQSVVFIVRHSSLLKEECLYLCFWEKHCKSSQITECFGPKPFFLLSLERKQDSETPQKFDFDYWLSVCVLCCMHVCMYVCCYICALTYIFLSCDRPLNAPVASSMERSLLLRRLWRSQT